MVDKLNALYLLSKGLICAVDMTSFNRIFDINVISKHHCKSARKVKHDVYGNIF